MAADDIMQTVNENTPLDKDGTHPEPKQTAVDFSHKANERTMGIDGDEYAEHAIHSAAATEHAMAGNSQEAVHAHLAAAEAHQAAMNELPDDHPHQEKHQSALDAHLEAANQHTMDHGGSMAMSLVEFGSGEGFKAFKLGLDNVVYVHDDGSWEHHNLSLQESDAADKATTTGKTEEELKSLVTKLAKDEKKKVNKEKAEADGGEEEVEEEENDGEEPVIVEEEEPDDNPDAVDPGTNQAEDERKLQAIMSRLPQFGINLPSDTDCCNLVDRLLTAMMTAESTKNLISEEQQSENPEEDQNVDNYQEASPAFAAMALKTKAAHNFAEQMHRNSITKRLDDLEKSGRCTPAEAKQQREQIGQVQLSLDSEGKPRQSPVETFIANREALPNGAAWKAEERLRMSGATEAPLSPSVVGEDVDNMTPEEVDKWSDNIVDQIYNRKRFPTYSENGNGAAAK